MDQIAAGPVASRPAFASWLGTTNDITRMFLAAGRIQGLINLAGGLPDPAVYPVREIAALAEEAVSAHPGDSLNYAPIEGLPELRDLIAERFSDQRVRLGRENVLIISGGMQGLDLIGKVLLDDGGLIAAQAPTYVGALDAWRPRNPVFRPFDLGRPEFDAVQALQGAQFAYTVPNFSNPSGRLVGAPVREALVGAADQTGVWLVEDDPYGSLHYDGAPQPRMLSLSGSAEGDALYRGPVIYLGTISKSLAPGLRVGWVIAAPEMIEALTMAKQGSDICGSGLSQRIALKAIETGLIDRIQPEIAALYRQRRDTLIAAMNTHLSKWFDWETPVGGMFVWAVARDPSLDTNALLPAALDAGVCVAPGSVFDPLGKDRRAFRINFTLNPPEKLAEGIRRLAGVLQRRDEETA
ncbi:PLP-dependent aminotransferase family protein [Pikeienuella sp. HZG-20]|uniref:aminotransferase-like domain-containing protein n=1 Tax=Paludibacillus litoralis TaxID=3133267 RepID=UPI0030EBF9D6